MAVVSVAVLVGAFVVGLAWAGLSWLSERAGRSGPGVLPEDERERLAG